MDATRARMRRAAAAALAAALLAAAGCARLPAPVPQPPTGPAPVPTPPPPPVHAVPGYEALAESLAAVDASGLGGRRIALDPGHGGFFPGARGVHGLAEAEVNLGVALRLRDLLAARGAVVFLTRVSDRDFLTRADSSLKGDLTERMRLANAFAPDVFLSIHHNADAAGAHDINETQTYYKLGDSGPSLDLAQDLHRSLVRNVGIRPHKVVPGNYFVLRNSEAPGVLTETSYITNPDVEERLRLPDKQELEAEALFIGLARYFARPVPVITRFAATDPREPNEDTLFVRGEPVLTAEVAGDFDQAELDVDGVRESPDRIGPRLEWHPPLSLWAPGAHRVMLRVRLAGVGTARERRLSFTKVCRPSQVRATAWPAAARPGGWFALRIEVRDAVGRLCPDSTPVRVREVAPRASAGAPARAGLAAGDTLVTARDGIAWAYLSLARPAAGARGPGSVRVRAALAADRLPRPPGPRGAPARADTARVAVERGPRAPWTGFVRDPAGEPLRDAPGTAEPGRTLGWLTRDGFAVIGRDSAGALETPRLAGFRRLAPDNTAAPAFVPLFGGALAGRRITLDPEGGGEDAAGVGPSGTRAANLNLESARILAGYLTAAGAVVHLTRDGDFAVSEPERVQGSEDFVADRYLRIGHRLRRFGYYVASPAGRKWAASAAATFAALGLRAPVYGEEFQYPLQQTSCTALYASAARVDSAADEEALLAPGALRAEAYGLFVALAREWTEAKGWPADSLEVRDADGAPVAGAIVTLGGAIALETDRLGRARFARTEPGPIEASVAERRVRARAVLLDSTRGAVLTGSRGN